MPTYNDENMPDGLHGLLLKAVPPSEHGNRAISHLAKLIPVRRWSVNKWLKKNKIPPDRALRIVEIGLIDVEEGQPGRVKIEDFHPYVYTQSTPG
jgi:hypothetical protein